MRNSIIEHKGNMFYVELREDYLLICQQCTYRKQVKGQIKSKASPYCKAFILSIMESWTNNKRGSGKLAVFMSYRQWSDEMYGMFGRTIIIDSIDELIGEGLLSREAYKMSTGQDTFQYTLNYKEVNKRIHDLPEGKANVTRPKVDGSHHQSKSERVPVQKGTRTSPQVDEYPSISSQNVSSTQNQLNINTSSSARNHNAPALSNAQVNPSSQNNAEESISPTAEETGRETPNACLETEKVTQVWFKDSEQQALWVVTSQAFTLQKKRVPEMILESWDRPTTRQREQIVEIVQKIKGLGHSTQEITPEIIEDSWVAKMEREPFLKRDPIAKLGNMRDALVEQLTIPQEAPQPDMPELTAEESEEEVLWASKPSTIERLFAQNATMEVHEKALGDSLRMMSRSEARDFNYDAVAQHYSPEQVEWYRLKTETRELVRIAG